MYLSKVAGSFDPSAQSWAYCTAAGIAAENGDAELTLALGKEVESLFARGIDSPFILEIIARYYLWAGCPLDSLRAIQSGEEVWNTRRKHHPDQPFLAYRPKFASWACEALGDVGGAEFYRSLADQVLEESRRPYNVKAVESTRKFSPEKPVRKRK